MYSFPRSAESDSEEETLMSLFLGRLAILAVACAAASPSNAQVLTHKDLSYALAKTIAEGSIESCVGRGYNVSAVVVNRAGETIAALRGDNSGPHTMENARRKAYTAMTFKQPSDAIAKKFAANDPTVREQMTLPNMIAINGGLPIKAGNEVIGGAGVSGSPGVDQECVQAALDKVADQLK
jgi:uncharacterized protein GlcG (DUF336 family)